MVCPYCRNGDNQVKAGMRGERQRYKCSSCQHRYVAGEDGRSHPHDLRQRALSLHARGVSIRDIGLQVGASGQSVRNWLRTDTPARDANNPNETLLPPTESNMDADLEPPVLKRRPTISDVARQAGVSRSTVSNLLNGKGRMSAETRGRVQSAMDGLHFSPSALVRAIHSQRTHILGVLIFGLTAIGQDDTAGPTSPLLAGIAAAAAAASYNILLYTGWEGGASRQAALQFLSGHIDGLIWVAPALHEPALDRLAEAGLPVVALLSRHVPNAVGFVNVDNIACLREMVVYLGGLGHRRIAYIGAERDSNFLDRHSGYREGLSMLGLAYDPLLDVQGNFDPLVFRNIVRRWMLLPSPPTAIVAPSDSWATAVGQAVQEAGFQVPGDVSVTGFDGSSAAGHIFGGLTTIRPPFREMGQIACERLLSIIDGKPAVACRVIVPAEIILRASTAAVEQKD